MVRTSGRIVGENRGIVGNKLQSIRLSMALFSVVVISNMDVKYILMTKHTCVTLLLDPLLARAHFCTNLHSIVRRVTFTKTRYSKYYWIFRLDVLFEPLVDTLFVDG